MAETVAHPDKDSCRDFDRDDSSLIEEPSVCENCRWFEDGVCRKE